MDRVSSEEISDIAAKRIDHLLAYLISSPPVTVIVG